MHAIELERLLAVRGLGDNEHVRLDGQHPRQPDANDGMVVSGEDPDRHGVGHQVSHDTPRKGVGTAFVNVRADPTTRIPRKRYRTPTPVDIREDSSIAT